MAVTDSTIGNLPAANLLENADMFAIEQGGEAKKLTGLKLKDFIQGAGEIFVATRTTYYTDVEAALADGKFVVYVDNNNRVYIHQEKRGTTHFFVGVGVGNTPPNLNATYTYATLTSPRMWVESFTKELQALLTWDATPTANSNNPVRSGGIKTYVDDAIAAIPEIEVDDALSDTSENPVQNKVITDAIYNSLATDSASGSIASFPDGADDIPVKSLLAQITPVQAGSGDPAPDNIRPISGWTGAEITRTGKNFCPYGTETFTKYSSQLPLDLPVGTYTISALVTSSDTDDNSSRFNITDKVGYTLVNDYFTRNARTSITFTITKEAGFIRFYAAKTANAGEGDTATWADVQIEEGSTATTYEEYKGNTINVDWTSEGTVYGGTLTYIGGGKYSLQATKGNYICTGAEAEWVASGANAQLNKNVLLGRITGSAYVKGICSMASSDENGYINTAMLRANSASGAYLQCRGVIGASSWGQDFQTVDNWKSWLATNYANGTPLQVTYDLGTLPDPIILDAEDVKTLLGDNNIFVDTGNVDVTYRADTALYIEKKLGA